MEFQLVPDGSIQRRELGWTEGDTSWQTLSRPEVIHYLNYGGVVGVWLSNLVDQGLLKVRQQPRDRILFPIVPRKQDWTRGASLDLGLSA